MGADRSQISGLDPASERDHRLEDARGEAPEQVSEHGPRSDMPASLARRMAAQRPRGVTRGGWMALQRTIGNRAVAQLLHRPRPQTHAAPTVGGLMPGVSEDANVVLGGSPGSSSVLQGPLLATDKTKAAAVTVSSTSNTGPTWSDHGHFDWRVGFTTSGKTGWLVQEIINTLSGEDSEGEAITAASVGVVPHYWEAWAVDGSSKVTPAVGADNDYWIRPEFGADSEGEWSMQGDVHWTTTDPATQGFTAGGVSNAGDLLSTRWNSVGLGSTLLKRNANGKWDSTGETPTHTGKAGP